MLFIFYIGNWDYISWIQTMENLCVSTHRKLIIPWYNILDVWTARTILQLQHATVQYSLSQREKEQVTLVLLTQKEKYYVIPT